MSKSALGRGLGALLGGGAAQPKPADATKPPVSPPPPTAAQAPTPTSVPGERVERVSLSRIKPSPLQPRKEFAVEAIAELAASIKEQGFIQPLIVRKRGETYELIAGERRLRAAQSIGLEAAPVIVREADDRTVLELALIENLQRENLNAIEEALGYAQLGNQFKLTQEQIAQKVGKSRVAVANSLRLLNLSSDVQGYVRTGRLSVGHAKVILGLSQAADQKLAADEAVRQNLSVRGMEQWVAQRQSNRPSSGSASSKAAGTPVGDTHVRDIQNKLTQKLGTKVGVKYKGGKGSVEIQFFSDAELERVLELLGVKID